MRKGPREKNLCRSRIFRDPRGIMGTQVWGLWDPQGGEGRAESGERTGLGRKMEDRGSGNTQARRPGYRDGLGTRGRRTGKEEGRAEDGAWPGLATQHGSSRLRIHAPSRCWFRERLKCHTRTDPFTILGPTLSRRRNWCWGPG